MTFGMIITVFVILGAHYNHRRRFLPWRMRHPRKSNPQVEWLAEQRKIEKAKRLAAARARKG